MMYKQLTHSTHFTHSTTVYHITHIILIYECVQVNRTCQNSCHVPLIAEVYHFSILSFDMLSGKEDSPKTVDGKRGGREAAYPYIPR